MILNVRALACSRKYLLYGIAKLSGFFLYVKTMGMKRRNKIIVVVFNHINSSLHFLLCVLAHNYLSTVHTTFQGKKKKRIRLVYCEYCNCVSGTSLLYILFLSSKCSRKSFKKYNPGFSIFFIFTFIFNVYPPPTAIFQNIACMLSNILFFLS